MNLTSADPTALPPQPPQPTRSSSSCPRHPNEHFTGFCSSCLFERLNTLDPSSTTPSSSHRPSSAVAAVKSLFSSTTSRANNLPAPPPPAPPKLPKPTTSFLPELRRSKSYSASKNEALGLSFEPSRKSLDVRAENTLSSLFSIGGEVQPNKPISASSSSRQIHQNINISSSKPIEDSGAVNNPVLGEIENEEDFKDPSANIDDIIVDFDDDNDDRDEIKPVEEDAHLQIINVDNKNNNNSEIFEEENVGTVNNKLKPMKDHIDLVTQVHRKKSSGGGGFWSAASVFTKKLRNWGHKQKIKKQNAGKSLFSTLPAEKRVSGQYRETQSEIADYGFGRRSIDIDPRFSLDAGRMSFDNPRYSFDEPRASYDGHLINAAPLARPVSRADMQIPLDNPGFINEPENLPGGTAQTRDYYLDSSSKRRKSVELERSSSIRQMAAAVVAEIDEIKTGSASNSRVLPTNTDYFQRDAIRDSYPNSLRDDASEMFEVSSGYRVSLVGNNMDKKETKKSKKWGWKLLGFMGRRNNLKGDEYESQHSNSMNGVERSLSQSWQELRRGDDNRNMLRSNSSVSWRNGNGIGQGPLVGPRRSNVEMYGNGKKRGDHIVSDKKRNVRYSPNNLDNGLLRFYLTPTRTNHRRGGTGKVKPANPNSVSRNVMRMY
ncbi:hypothetical protein CASFOL_015685 [Castilleja foliolosa]|uniref:Uncharacterized protein n=1 Tax=Castilleja foliolosa TaxID=1961234 RepID=A0ABD3DGA9_9LAMI